MEWRPTILVSEVHIGTASDELLGQIHVTIPGGVMQIRPAKFVELGFEGPHRFYAAITPKVIMARTVERIKLATRNCRQCVLRQLAAKTKAIKNTVNRPHAHSTWNMPRVRGTSLSWIAVTHGTTPDRMGQLSHSCRQ